MADTQTPILSAATWEEAWIIVKALQFTGDVTVQCAQGEPKSVDLPGPVTKIRIDKRGKRR